MRNIKKLYQCQLAVHFTFSVVYIIKRRQREGKKRGGVSMIIGVWGKLEKKSSKLHVAIVRCGIK